MLYKLDNAYYSTEHKNIEKITATEAQPHRTVLNYFAVK